MSAPSLAWTAPKTADMFEFISFHQWYSFGEETKTWNAYTDWVSSNGSAE